MKETLAISKEKLNVEKGCAYCTEMHLNRCPDAFSKVSPNCGIYNHEKAVMLSLEKEN